MSHVRHRQAARLRHATLIGATVLVSIAAGATAAQAIPSPELVVGSLSSLSQLVALVSATLGGGAVWAGSRAAGPAAGPSPGRRYLALGLAVAAVASIALNAYLVTRSIADRRTRLEATLIRPTPKRDGQALDPLLKEIPYAEQQRHPRGMSTADAEALVADMAAGRRPDWMLLDIRETPETEMGTIAGARAVRFPDIAGAGLDLEHRKPLLFCHNGNRSAETCNALAARGIDCRFIVGGLEKWLSEGRPLAGVKARTLAELRAIPDYPNHQRLIDTPEAHQLVAREAAVFVDVRYPGEFAAGHLPGAVNLPIRPTPTAELERRLAELPRKPVIAPCYDRRSCFFAEILGLQVTRAGGDFRGRYTVPWEYFVPPARPPHVEAALAAAHVSVWDKARAAIAGVLARLAAVIGLPLALVLLAACSRLLVMPFSIKSERDQIESRRMEADVRRLRRELAGDPGRQRRALAELYARHGLTPGYNLVALAFLPVLALSVGAAGDAAARTHAGFAWIADLAARDELLVLPAAFAVLVGLYVHWTLARKPWHRLLTWLVVAPLLAVAVALLPAAAGLYMVASAVLLLVQRAFVSGAIGRAMWSSAALLRRAVTPRLPDAGLVPLGDPARLADAGNKALRLARLAALGLPVPDGVVLTTPFLARWPRMDARRRARIAAALWRRLGSRPVAVRSSGRGEDAANASFAGVFETVLDVDRAGLPAAIDQVLASFSAARVAAYATGAGGANILVQPMLAADYAGVLFTEDPESPGLVLIELVEGGGEQLVSGRVAPRAYRLGRLTGLLRSPETPPVPLQPLLQLALRAEALFGAPQDIEWVYCRGRFFLVQSRDVTTASAVTATPEAAQHREEWRRLAAVAATGPLDGPLLAQNEMSEMLPRPTPASLSLTEALWASGGSVDLAARALGLDYRVGEAGPPYHVTAFGRLYVDKRQESARAPRLGPAAVRRILARSRTAEADFREAFLPVFLAEMRLMAATDLDRLPTLELVATFRGQLARYLTVTHVAVDIVNILARFHLDRARRAMTDLGHDTAAVLADIPVPAATEALQLAAVAPKPWREFQLREALGHRAVLDYELAEPRFGESPQSLETAAARAVDTLWRTAVGRAAAAALDGLPARARAAVETARRLQTLKEDAKHHALRHVAVLRQLVLALDRRFALDGLAFYLTVDELAGLEQRTARELASLAAARKSAAAAFRCAPAPGAEVTAADIETSGHAGRHRDTARKPLHGTRVAGSRPAHGRAFAVSAADAEAGSALAGFEDGDIIVTPLVHPAWLAEVVRSGGVVSGVGGWLSHMAIVAREHDVTMIIGADGLDAVPNGAHVTLHLDGRVEVQGRQSPVEEHPAVANPAEAGPVNEDRVDAEQQRQAAE